MSWLKKLCQVQVTVDLGDYPQELSEYFHNLAERSIQDPTDDDPFTHENADAYIPQVVAKTNANMQKIVVMVQQAIQNIPGWNNSPVVVRPAGPSEEYGFGPNYLEPVTDVYIQVGSKEAWGGYPEFTMFVDNGAIEIDDVLDSGDRDFFAGHQSEMDYFSLIRELRHPGGSASNKILTLYTARPMKDRELYEGATTVPSGIFLTSNYSVARVIGYDLPGQDKVRDVWRLKIEEQYLMQTLDAPTEKQYQVVGNGQVPVRSIKLVDPGA